MQRLNVADAAKTEASFLSHKFPGVATHVLHEAGTRIADLKAQVRKGSLSREDLAEKVEAIHAELTERTQA